MCGDGELNGTEECDGNDLDGLTCLDYGFENGSLLCTDECDLFTDACSTCGDGLLSATEACDGDNFGGQSCQGLGYAGGTLSCAPDCSQVLESGCTQNAGCGNGQVDGGEQCDGGNLGGQTCQSQGFDGGTLACTPSCVLDTSGCTAQTCKELFSECNALFQDCCPGLICAVFCIPEF